MLKKTGTSVCLVLLLMASMGINKVEAIGLGFYGTTGSGSGSYSLDEVGGTTDEGDVDIKQMGYGFVLDTAVAKNQVYNYRLNFGIEEVDSDYKPESTSQVYPWELDRYVLTQDFGFAFFKREFVRLWVGPELKLSYATGQEAADPTVEAWLFGVGVGPVLGANFNFGPVFTLGLKGGYLFEGYAGQLSEPGVEDQTLTMSNGNAFLNIAAIFRIKDSYN